MSYPHHNTVGGLVTGGATWENRPQIFYFGNLGDDVEACHMACAAEADCLAYALHTLAFGSHWGTGRARSTAQHHVWSPSHLLNGGWFDFVCDILH